jgi:hypothetical protein
MTGDIIQVENLEFTFDDSVAPFQHEKSSTCVHGWPNGFKVLDIVAHMTTLPPDISWLIEAKDYRRITKSPKASNLSGLAYTVEAKVRNSVSAFRIVAQDSNNDAARSHASTTISSKQFRVVLHLEPHPESGPNAIIFPPQWAANVLLQLKSRLSDIDTNPLVLDIARTAKADVPWTTT